MTEDRWLWRTYAGDKVHFAAEGLRGDETIGCNPRLKVRGSLYVGTADEVTCLNCRLRELGEPHPCLYRLGRTERGLNP